MGLLLGPGTISMLLLPRRARSQKFTAAVFLNFLAWIAIMVGAAMLKLHGG